MFSEEPSQNVLVVKDIPGSLFFETKPRMEFRDSFVASETGAPLTAVFTAARVFYV